MAKFVLIVAGQSQAAGRALNSQLLSLYPEIYNHAFTTKIWSHIAEGVELGWPGYVNPNYGKVDGWETLNPAYNQSYQQSDGQHGLEPAIAYKFEQEHPNDELFIIKYAYGGIPLHADAGVDFSPSSNHEMYYGLVNYYLLPAFASAELATGYTSLGFWWAHGESDGIATNPEYTHIEGNSHVYLDSLMEFFALLSAAVPKTAKSVCRRYLGQSLTKMDTDGTPTQAPTAPAVTFPYVVSHVIPDQQTFCANTANAATLISAEALPIKGGTYVEDPHFDAVAYVQLADILLPQMIASAIVVNSGGVPPVPAPDSNAPVELVSSVGGPVRYRIGRYVYPIGIGGNGPVRMMTSQGVVVLS